ncbi:MAG: winged helix DNA-binding protein [Candidatus Dojkabacteria bacterium]
MLETIWPEYGLRSDPFDTMPLIEGGDINIEKAFVGRKSERDLIDEIFSATNGSRITITGDVGVGKTSFTNFEKYLWKYQKKERGIFSFRGEIEAKDTLLNKNTFLLEIIASTLNEIQLLDSKLSNSNAALKTLKQLVEVTEVISRGGGIDINVLGTGGGANYSQDASVFTPAAMPTATLEKYFHELIEVIRREPIKGKSYENLLIHVNNFVNVIGDLPKLRKFFNEIRDILQTKYCHFVFLGPEELFGEVIAKERRLSSIFHYPTITLTPLSKNELAEALDERLDILKSTGVVEVIKPYSRELLFSLHDLYNGEIRSILNALSRIVRGSATPRAVTNNEGLLLLAHTIEKELSQRLKPKLLEVTMFFAREDRVLTQKEIVKALNLQQANLSQYLGTLTKNGVVKEVENEGGKIKNYRLTESYRPLKFSNLESKTAEEVKQVSSQLELFMKQDS